jgi:hypothetical protein
MQILFAKFPEMHCALALQTSFGDVYRLDLVRKHWTRLEQRSPAWLV